MTIIFRKVSILSGKVNEMLLPLDEREYAECFRSWRAGALVQEAFPMLNDTQREFLMTGLSEEEQRAFFTEDEEK